MPVVGPKRYYQVPRKVSSTIGVLPIAAPTPGGGIGLPSATAEASTPLIEKKAEGNSPLDVAQRGAVIGEVIPIVFCRRTGGTGGVLISPPATEARFEDDASSNITASYHLVLSEGQIDSIQVRDVFQRSCRVGSFTQTYDRRAGTFVAGNFIDNTPNLEAPTYCGTSGTYDGLSTMAFSVTIPAGFDQWDRQVHCFIRGGIYVSRLLDSVTGPSNNVADLLLYLLRNSSRVPESMIDTATSFLAAATFTNANGFWFNGVVSESTNLRDWISSNLQYFLLRQARIGGKEALKPLVPTNNDGTIKTTAVSWVFTFTEQHIIPGSFEITYSSLADRKPFCATVLWRQQDDLGIPVMRNAEVRYTGTAVDGPYEQHDLSGFCASENHAVKVGAYILSKRKHVTHRLQIGVKPDGYNPTLAAGDLVRVRLDRIASTGANSVHDYLYEVDRIGKSITGEVQLDLTHFPVDAARASVVAQEVNAATGTGLLLPTGLSGITCDVNSSADTSVPAETFTEGVFSDYTCNIEDFGGGAFDGGDAEPVKENPEDVLDKQDIDPQLNNFVVWYDNESARVFGPSSAVITLNSSRGDYETTEHLGQTAFAQPPGAEGEFFYEVLFHEWSIQIPDQLTDSDFTIEAWMRSNDALPSGGAGYVNFQIRWGEDTELVGGIGLGGQVQFNDGAAVHQASFSSLYGDGLMSNEQSFGTTVQGWKHFCYQRISGEDVFHYHGVRVELTQESVEPLPSSRPITSDSYLILQTENQTTSGTALGQVCAAVDAKYGFNTFTPPSIPFYSPP